MSAAAKPPQVPQASPAPKHASNRKHTSALAVSREEASNLIGISLDTFEEHVLPHLRVCKIGRRVVVPVKELGRWLDANSAVYGVVR
jgi:hypothetical protein